MKSIIELFQQIKTKKVIEKFKDELGEKIMTEFRALRAKAYSFLIDGYSDEDYEKKQDNK